MVVHVKLLGFLKRWCEQPRLDVQVEAGSTVRDVIYRLADQLGDDFRRAILDWRGQLHGGVELVLNGQEISAQKMSEITLTGESELALIPMIAGG